MHQQCALCGIRMDEPGPNPYARATGMKASVTSVGIVPIMSGATDTLCVHPSRFLSQVDETVQRILWVRRPMGRRGQKVRAVGIGYNKGYKICRHFQRG